MIIIMIITITIINYFTSSTQVPEGSVPHLDGRRIPARRPGRRRHRRFALTAGASVSRAQRAAPHIPWRHGGSGRRRGGGSRHASGSEGAEEAMVGWRRQQREPAGVPRQQRVAVAAVLADGA